MSAKLQIEERLRRRKASYLKYHTSKNGKAARQKYKTSEKGKAAAHKYKISERVKALYREHWALGKGKDRRRAYVENNRETIRLAGRRQMRKLRVQVLDQYGRSCACCGESIETFLAIDHINGGGNKHVKSLTTHFYQWLKNNHWPPGFQVLCHNCNQGKRINGICPHQSMRLGEEPNPSPSHLTPQ